MTARVAGMDRQTQRSWNFKEGSDLKSKEPKQPKERKKSEAKPRKISEKGKRAMAQPAAEPQMMPSADPAAGAFDMSANGAGDPPAAALIAAQVDPPEEMIRMRAYELFVQRGCEHGHHLDDWLAAERELKSKLGAA